MEEPLLECSFPIPILRDGDRQPHQPHAWDDLTIELRTLVKSYPRGHQGPKTVFHWEEDVTPGEYEEGPASGVTHDESRKYWIALPAEKVGDLRAMLRRACNTFDQRAIYLSVAGRVEFIEAQPEAGVLNLGRGGP
jgi:hypothetical protein